MAVRAPEEKGDDMEAIAQSAFFAQWVAPNIGVAYVAFFAGIAGLAWVTVLALREAWRR
ncbi:hypothetical protein [Synergistes jonesii]|uniref:hypothetical protein n=1 Tax=Synergistes jonesii TaxID=2754 RepID=UPI00242BA5DF|nr:hypothetical protein [Synergistes jonesii]